MEWLFVVMLLGGWLVPSIAIGAWAERSGRSFLKGFLTAFLVSPLIGAVLVASQNDKRGMRVIDG